VAVICEDSWLDSCDVVVPIWPLSSCKGLPHEEHKIKVQEEDSLVRCAWSHRTSGIHRWKQSGQL